jgi:tRNA pseudouridine55 synthase
MVNGVLIVNKPSGMTSHDVVNHVRCLFETRRVGHTGTLDPMATGVLVVLLGSATRLLQFMTQDEKSYRGTVRLGIQTTTYDAEGEIEETHPVQVNLTEIQATLEGFRGEINQIPPMYSAIKVKGQKLYNLARQGKTIDRKPRSVTIYHIDILKWELPDIVLDIKCSAGTYIRSLAHDIGLALGCGGHLQSLIRTTCHGFELQESHTLDELKMLVPKGDLTQVLLPPSAALGKMPSVILSLADEKAVRYGQKVTLPVEGEVGVLQAFNEHGHLVAVLEPDNNNYWQPKVVLPSTIQE